MKQCTVIKNYINAIEILNLNLVCSQFLVFRTIRIINVMILYDIKLKQFNITEM